MESKSKTYAVACYIQRGPHKGNIFFAENFLSAKEAKKFYDKQIQRPDVQKNGPAYYPTIWEDGYHRGRRITLDEFDKILLEERILEESGKKTVHE